MYRIADYIGERLDLLGSIVGSLIGAVIAALGYITHSSSTLGMGVSVSVACAIYLLFVKKMRDQSCPSLPSSTLLTLALNIIFISTFAASVFVTHFSLYLPPLYFLLISIAVAAVAAEILSSESKAQTWLLLLKILLISLNLRAGIFYQLPGILGYDAWVHVSLVEVWINSGHITPAFQVALSGTTYVDFPVMHLAVIATRLITSLNPKDSLFLSVGIFNIISALFIFLIVQRLLDRRSGLLAALLISIAVPHIYFGWTLISNSLGFVIFAIIIFLVFKSAPSFINSLLLIVLSVTLVLTHTVSTFIMSIVLALIYMANEVYTKGDRVNVERINISFTLTTLFVVLMIGRWIYCLARPGSGGFFTVVFSSFVRALRMDVELTGTAVCAESASTLNKVWFYMLIIFTIIGTLYWLSRKMRNNLRKTVITCTYVPSILLFIFPVFNIWSLLPGRWTVFVLLFSIGLVVQGILVVPEVVNGKIKKAVLVVIIVFAFSMFSINNGGVNWQTPFYEEHSRSAFTQSELSAADTISRTCDGVIAMDGEFGWLAFNYAEFVFGTPSKFSTIAPLNPGDLRSGLIVRRNGSIRTKVSQGYSVPSEDLVVIRKYLYSHPEVLGGDVELESDFFTKFNSTEYGTMYDNGEVKAYLPK